MDAIKNFFMVTVPGFLLAHWRLLATATLAVFLTVGYWFFFGFNLPNVEMPNRRGEGPVEVAEEPSSPMPPPTPPVEVEETADEVESDGSEDEDEDDEVTIPIPAGSAQPPVPQDCLPAGEKIVSLCTTAMPEDLPDEASHTCANVMLGDTGKPLIFYLDDGLECKLNMPGCGGYCYCECRVCTQVSPKP